MSGGFNPNVHAPFGSAIIQTPFGTRIITPDGRVMGTNPNEAAVVNPWGSQTPMVWDPASGSMVPLSSMGRGMGEGGMGGMGGLGPSSIIQIPGVGVGGIGGMGGMGGQFGTVTINGVPYPSRGGYGGHRPGRGRGEYPTNPSDGWQGGWGGHGNHGEHRGGHGGHGRGWDTVGPVPPGSRPVDPYRDFDQPHGRGGGDQHPGTNRPPTSNIPSGGPTIPKKLRDAPEKVREEDLASDGKDCSICYKPFFEEEDGEVEIPVKLRSCGHIFGEKCINEWVQTNNSCPTCRKGFAAVGARMMPGSGGGVNRGLISLI